MKEKWTFYAFKNERDYTNWKPYFKKTFYSHAKLKAFSASHSANEKQSNPDYISTYIKQTSQALTRSCKHFCPE